MPKPAKQIPEAFQSEIADFAKQGYSNNWIANHCKDKGFSIDARVVGRYLDRIGIEQKGKKVTFEKTLHSKKTDDKDEIILTPIVVDLQALFKRFAIPDDLSTADNIVDATQKMTAQIFMLEAAILYTRLEEHSKGKCKHPNEQFRGYRIACEVMEIAWGYKQSVNLSQALKTLESEGYEIQGMRLIEESGDV